MLHQSTAASISTHFLLLALTLISPIGFASQYTNADIDGDAIVSSQDISKLASCFGENPASNNDCAKADVDEDGDIDVDDFSFVSSRLGQAYPWMLFPSPTYNAGSNPGSLVLGDVNKDAVLDAVLISSGGLSVLLGNGDGSFQVPRYFDVSNMYGPPYLLALGDMNGDGALDVVVANEGTKIFVLLGNGDGGFQAPRFFGTNSFFPLSLALADVNGDSELDIVISYRRYVGFSVLLGNGDGSFQGARRFAVSNRSGTYLGDVNGDGALDAVVMTIECTVSMLLGNGDGSFQAPQPIIDFDDCSERRFNLVALSDVNGDGTLDMMLKDYGQNEIYYLSGIGDGSFQEPQWIIGNLYTESIALGDMNGDGTLDIVICELLANHANGLVAVEEIIRSGDTLRTGQRNQYYTGSIISFPSLGDLNGDGKLDAVVTNGGGSGGRNDILVLLGKGDGSLQGLRFSIDEAYWNPNFVSVGDMNGDGMADVVKVNEGESSDISVWQSNGDGSFQAPQRYAVDDWLGSLALGDVNRDGVLDAVVISLGGVLVLLGNGDGGFQAPLRFAVDEVPVSLALGDMNGDSMLDVVVNSVDCVSVLLGNGDGGFQMSSIFAFSHKSGPLSLGDVNGDGVLDVVLAFLRSDKIWVLLGNGEGGFQAKQRFDLGSRYVSLALGDINGDGTLDFVVSNYYAEYEIDILLGNDEGGFQVPHGVHAGFDSWSLSLGDVNSDGALDIIVSDVFSENISLLLGNGDGGFQDRQRFVVGAYSMIGSGDVNGDGLLDVVLQYANNDSFSALLNRGRMR